VEIEPPPESSIVYMDPARMGQVVRNLLSNAIKFTPSQRQVRLRLKPALIPNGRRRQERGDAPAWLLEVSDEGVGIPEGELSAVFDKFIQSSKTRTGAGGTGLGLAICTEIVAEHRGRIWAENNAAGGATFKLLLPQDTRNLRHEPRQAATPAR
jgi:signal transduction histidine kinase